MIRSATGMTAIGLVLGAVLFVSVKIGRAHV